MEWNVFSFPYTGIFPLIIISGKLDSILNALLLDIGVSLGLTRFRETVEFPQSGKGLCFYYSPMQRLMVCLSNWVLEVPASFESLEVVSKGAKNSVG